MYIQISHILPLILLSANSLVAQITGNANVKDAKALPITSEHKALLCGKKWTCLKMIEFLRGSTVELEKGGKKVEFGCNGEFRDFIGKKGEWKIVNNQFVQISIVPRSVDSKHLLRGPYSVYKISDSSLVLGQILTSSGDWTREYTFTSSESSIHSYPPPLVYRPRYDSLREGKRIIYDEKGKVSAIEKL